ncbi:MAG: site-specific integrase [Alphaproteobacteria bacterium]|nr:site-specific integrase [Alphaproteobacteria bacterium]
MATFQQRSGKWRAIVRRKSKSGYKAISKTFLSKEEAVEWAVLKEGDRFRGAYVDSREAERTTLEEALDRYESEITPSKKGAKQERLRIAAWKRSDLAMRPLATIRGTDLASWRDTRLADDVSPTTVRNDLALISHLFTIAIKEWGMESLTNPVTKMRLPRAAKARDRRLVEGEEKKLLAACEASPCKLLAQAVRIALETAMRQGEILSLTWPQVNLKRRFAKLKDTKNGEDRNVPLSPQAVAVFKEMLTAHGEEVEVLPRGPVFPIKQDSLVHFYRKVVKDAGIEDLTFHDLRHEATSRLFERGVFTEKEVAEFTGHKTPAMLWRYTHLKAEDLAKKMD